MNCNNDRRKKSFQLLDEIGDLDQQEIQNYFSEDNIEAIRITLKELLEDEDFPEPMSPSTFSELVHKLRQTKRIWGRKLGDALISAGDIADKGDIEGAIDILREFIKICPSLFHKEHAQNQIEYYIKKRGRSD